MAVRVASRFGIIIRKSARFCALAEDLAAKHLEAYGISAIREIHRS